MGPAPRADNSAVQVLPNVKVRIETLRSILISESKLLLKGEPVNLLLDVLDLALRDE